MATKPSDALHEWTDGDSAKVTEPGAGKKLSGFVHLEKPPFEHVNWLFYLLFLWAEYFEDVTDEILAVTIGEYDRIVGSNPAATDADLATAIANATDGDSILVLENQSLVSTITLGKNNIYIKFKGGVTFSDGGANTGLNITGDRNRIDGARWSGFGTTAINIAAGADYNMIRDNWFTGNTAEVTDASTTSDEQGSIYE